MKEATSLLRKVRLAARRRLLLDEARRWAFVACSLLFVLRVASAFGALSGIVRAVCLTTFLCYTLFRAALFRRRVPTLYQTARRLETRDAGIQGVLSASLEFESTAPGVAFDSRTLRDATIDQARLWLERAFAEGRAGELRDLALRRVQNVRRRRRLFLERLGTLGAASLLGVSCVWFTPNEDAPETNPPEQTNVRESEIASNTATSVDKRDFSAPNPSSTSFEDDFAFLRATLARSVALADSLTRELRDGDFESPDSTALFQLAREFDSALASSSGLAVSVDRVRASLANLPKSDVDVLLLTRRLREFDEYLNENRRVGAELTRLLATSTRSFSHDVQNEAQTAALETIERTNERLRAEERALGLLAFGWEYSQKFEELEQERAELLREAVERLQARPGALADDDASDLTTSEFLTRLNSFAERWNARRDELETTARKLREPDAGEFVAFVARFADQTDADALLLGTERARVDLPGRFERPLASIRQIERNARVERWGKVASALSEASSARDMLGAEICESEDFSSTLAWRLAFGVFDGANDAISESVLTAEELENPTNSQEIDLNVAASREENWETLERMARAEEAATELKLTTRAAETQTREEIRASLDVPSRSKKASEEGSAPDENYAGGASARETSAPFENGTNAFSGELPDVAKKRLESGRRWNPPLEYLEKERAFQARLRKETRENRR